MLQIQYGKDIIEVPWINHFSILTIEIKFVYRSRKKGEKKRVIKDLNKQNMMPSKKFDYKAVDFSSFQGGSKNAPGQGKQVNFEQKMVRKYLLIVF